MYIQHRIYTVKAPGNTDSPRGSLTGSRSRFPGSVRRTFRYDLNRPLRTAGRRDLGPRFSALCLDVFRATRPAVRCPLMPFNPVFRLFDVNDFTLSLTSCYRSLWLRCPVRLPRPALRLQQLASPSTPNHFPFSPQRVNISPHRNTCNSFPLIGLRTVSVTTGVG